MVKENEQLSVTTTKVFNRTTEKTKRRLLRNNMPKAETILWSKLKGRQLLGYKFRRQYSVGRYVIDFYCPALKLAIEIYGDSHFQEGANQHDQERQRSIEQYGIRFLRFTNREVYENLTVVLQAIADRIEVLESTQ